LKTTVNLVSTKTTEMRGQATKKTEAKLIASLYCNAPTTGAGSSHRQDFGVIRGSAISAPIWLEISRRRDPGQTLARLGTALELRVLIAAPRLTALPRRPKTRLPLVA
jgi:hypothetical protein